MDKSKILTVKVIKLIVKEVFFVFPTKEESRVTGTGEAMTTNESNKQRFFLRQNDKFGALKA